jgi:RNA polymerase sigma-70 factor (ECF subfamily)
VLQASEWNAAEEAVLLTRLRAGDDDAYEKLVRDHTARMLSVARRYLGNEDDARDAVQDAFASAFKAIDTFHGDSRISTWLHRITVNAALMKLRARARRPERAIDDLLPEFGPGGHHAEPPSTWSESASAEAEREEARELVRRSIAELPEAYRTVLILRDIEGWENDELARHLGISVNAAKLRVHRARQALRTLIDPQMRGMEV